MSVAVVLLTLLLLAAVIAVVSRPLLVARTPEGTGKPTEAEAPRQEDLKAAREAKYREIRDAELDYRTGKLSGDDFEAVNATLRAEAVEILDQLDALDEQGRATDREAGKALEEAGTALDGPADSSTRVS